MKPTLREFHESFERFKARGRLLLLIVFALLIVGAAIGGGHV